MTSVEKHIDAQKSMIFVNLPKSRCVFICELRGSDDSFPHNIVSQLSPNYLLIDRETSKLIFYKNFKFESIRNIFIVETHDKYLY